MASETQPIKHRRYDASMSKRTRKPCMGTEIYLNQDDDTHKDNNSIDGSSVSPLNQEDEVLMHTNGVHHLSRNSLDEDDEKQNDNGIHRSSLKELMNQGNGQEKPINAENGNGMKASAPADKSCLTLVPRHGEGTVGGKKGGTVSRYVKVLSYLIKVKRDSKKKSVVRLLKP